MAELNERWAVTEAEKGRLEELSTDDEFVVGVDPEIVGHDEDCYVIVNRAGKCTNRWVDGTVGVPDEVKRDAEEADALIERGSGEEADEWIDVVTDENGRFLAPASLVSPSMR